MIRKYPTLGSGTAAMAVKGLRVDLGGTEVLHGIDLEIGAGRWTSMVGPNGAGKSTLLKAMAGLLPARGDVHLLGQPLRDLPGRVRAQRLSWLGQSESGADDLSAYDVTMLGRLPYQAWLAPPSEADRAAVAAELGLKPGTLNVRLHRARAALGNALLAHCGSCCRSGFDDCSCPPAGCEHPVEATDCKSALSMI